MKQNQTCADASAPFFDESAAAPGESAELDCEDAPFFSSGASDEG